MEKNLENMNTFLLGLDKELDNFVYDIMHRAIQKNQITIPNFDWSYLANFHMKQFPVSFTDSIPYLDYLFLKVKDHILNVFLFEASLRHKSELIDSSAQKRKRGVILDSEDAFQSIRQIIYEYLLRDDPNYDRRKTDVNYRTALKRNTEDCQKNLRKYILKAKKIELPEYFQLLNEETPCNNSFEYARRRNSYAQFEDNCKQRGSLELYWQTFLWCYLLFNDTDDLLPQDYATYIGFVSDIFREKHSLDERCLSYIRNYMKRNNEHGNSDAIYKDLYQRYENHIMDAARCLNSVKKRSGDQSEVFVTNRFLFTGLLKPNFFSSLSGSSLFTYCSDRIDFPLLYQNMERGTTNNDKNLLSEQCKKSESLSYLHMLELLMKFNIDLQELERKDFSLCFDEETRNLQIWRPREHYFFATYVALKIISDFLESSLSSMGEVLASLLEQFDNFCQPFQAVEIKSVLDSIAQLVLRNSEPTIDNKETPQFPTATHNQKLIFSYLLNQSCKGELFIIS